MPSTRSKSLAISSVLKEFGKYYTDLVSTREYVSPDEEDRRRDDRLRVSGFPYCGLKHAHKRLNGEEEESEQPVTFGQKYYTSVGTQTHRYVQYVLGHGMQIMGKWKCLTKGCDGTKKITFNNICPHCNRPMDYVELTVRRGPHLTGHLDGIWRSKEGKYYLIDYKTSSVRVIAENPKTGYLPYPKNVAQIIAYCALIERQYDIEISGWILMYLARDNPMQTALPIGQEISKKTKKKIIKKIDTWAGHYEVVMTADRFRDLMVLVDEKPCHSQEYYLESAYHSPFNPCPLGVSGICFKPKVLRQTLKEDWETKPKDWKTRRRPAYFKKLERRLQLDKMPGIDYKKL